jgi:methionyl-tRNA formyltransferase
VNVVAVATHADAPGEEIWFPSVAALARTRGLEPILVGEEAGPAIAARMKIAAPELILSVWFRTVLPPEVLAQPRLGAFNIHGSLLPKYRGRAPVNWAVLRGETRTGATLHRMSLKPDTGAIVDQEPVEIAPDDTAFRVLQKVTDAAVRLLDRQLPALKAGTAPERPQEEWDATTYPRRKPEDGRIDWSQPAQDVHNLVRAVTHPWPGAFTDVFGGKAYIWATRLPNLAAHDNFPGQVRTEDGRLFVACGDDRYVEVLRLQKEGEDERDAAAFLATMRTA